MSVFRSLLMANAAVDPLKVPLTFTAEEAGATVALNVTGITIPGMHYRMGKSGAWLPYTAGTVIDLPNIGDSCQFWNSAEKLGNWTNAYATFRVPKTVALGGNIQSMLNWIDEVPSGAFIQLFQGGNKFSSLPLMPSKELKFRSYYFMFGNSTIYQKKLVFDFLLLGQACDHFFQDVKYVESVEILGETSEKTSVFGAFQRLSTLKEIKVHFTSWSGEFYNWVNGVSPTGTFYKPSALPVEYGKKRIPEGWTVVNID